MIFALILTAAVVLLCVLWVVKDPCSGDCSQGRRCNCKLGGSL